MEMACYAQVQVQLKPKLVTSWARKYLSKKDYPPPVDGMICLNQSEI